MSKRWNVLAAAVVGAAVALPLLALANHVDVRDGNDTKGLLDIRRVEVTGSERPRWEIVTFSDWSVRRIFDRGYFLIRLDTFGDERYDYYALVRSNGFRMKGTLVRDRRSKPDVNVARIEAVHPTRTSVKARIPLAKTKIGRNRLTYRWQVQTLFSSDNCPRVCIDDAPNDRGVKEALPGVVQPTPTASPTPTATATSPVPSPTTSP